jgi:hypothetical protein
MTTLRACVSAARGRQQGGEADRTRAYDRDSAAGLDLAVDTPHSTPVGRMSLNITSASSSAPSGIRQRLVSACGMRRYSAWVPSISVPSIHPPVVQREYMPRRQYSQRPQAEMQEIRTRSPLRKLVTAGPTFSTVPTPSWPRIRPGLQVPTSPLRMCRSVPQMVVLTTFTTASVGAFTSGIGRSSSDFLPGPKIHECFHEFRTCQPLTSFPSPSCSPQTVSAVMRKHESAQADFARQRRVAAHRSLGHQRSRPARCSATFCIACSFDESANESAAAFARIVTPFCAPSKVIRVPRRNEIPNRRNRAAQTGGSIAPSMM